MNQRQIPEQRADGGSTGATGGATGRRRCPHDASRRSVRHLRLRCIVLTPGGARTVRAAPPTDHLTQPFHDQAVGEEDEWVDAATGARGPRRHHGSPARVRRSGSVVVNLDGGIRCPECRERADDDEESAHRAQRRLPVVDRRPRRRDSRDGRQGEQREYASARMRRPHDQEEHDDDDARRPDDGHLGLGGGARPQRPVRQRRRRAENGGRVEGHVTPQRENVHARDERALDPGEGQPPAGHLEGQHDAVVEGDTDGDAAVNADQHDGEDDDSVTHLLDEPRRHAAQRVRRRRVDDVDDDIGRHDDHADEEVAATRQPIKSLPQG